MYQSKYAAKTEKKNWAPVIIVLVVLAVVGGFATWFFCANVIVDGEIYPRNSEFLNLRGENVTFEHYDALREKLPGRRIYWDVPFQDGYYADDITELTITELSEQDIENLRYFYELKTIHAENCEEYAMLAKLQQTYPDCTVLYTVTIDGTEYAQDATEMTVANLTDEEVTMADYLPLLETVNAEECQDYAQLSALQERHPVCQVNYSVVVGEEKYPLDTKELNLTNQSIEQLTERVAYLPELKSVHLVDPEGGAEALNTLRETYPALSVTVELVGVTVSEDGKEVDLSAVTLTSLEDVDKYMAFYPDVKQVYLGQPEIENEEISAFRESRREQYKVVWTVMCGTIATRTDAEYFHPIQEGVYYFFDEDAYNLRYCEDMICVDVGHMPIYDIEWVTFMPNLKYLILAITNVRDITHLSTCKNLLFLEIDHTGINDYTPLLGCTSLEDLNLGLTFGDQDVIAQMTWLKNIWWMGKGGGAINRLRQAMPDTNIVFNVDYTTGGGWRQLQNYYDMRDVLHMEYMT